ncbi:MAG: hypothetical protein V7701_16400, partial [Sneathiella sp.]
MTKNLDLHEFSRISKGIFGNRWHYFGDHVADFTPFIQSVYKACIDLKVIDEHAPIRILREIYNIGGRENFEDHYDQLLQKLAEILVMRQVVNMSWPDETFFEIEANAQGGRKKVDLVATVPDGKKYGFEVKAPKHTIRTRQRDAKQFQFPVRQGEGLPGIQAKSRDNTLLPRDNTLRSFLRSADEKFEAFKASSEFCGVLVIVWDDWVYEAIGALLNDRNGLLTPETYSVINGAPEVFRNVDSVMILRHLTYFTEAAAERGLPNGRLDSMHIGGAEANPNIAAKVSNLELP